MAPDREAFERGYLRELPDVLADWRGRRALEDDVREILDREFERCDDLEFARRFAAGAPVEGCEPTDYLQRIVELDGSHAIIGSRMHGIEGFPFVDVVATTGPVDDSAALEKLLRRALDSYDVFEPEAVRIFRSADTTPPGLEGWSVEPDAFLHAAPVDELARREPVDGLEQLDLREVEDADEAADRVARWYEALFDEEPDLQSRIEPADADAIEACRQSGRAAWAQIDGERAGLIATCGELGMAVRGQCVVEEVLADRFRGRGLGAALQQSAVDRLADTHSDAILWGTIDAANVASRVTARRVGRPAIAAWHWFRPEAAAG